MNTIHTSLPHPGPASRARDSWSGQLASYGVGSAIGLGNIWRFGVSYSNGARRFLVPYLVALIFVGIPMLGLRLRHKFHIPRRGQFAQDPGRRIIGWFQTFVCIVIMVYYGVQAQYTIYPSTRLSDDLTSFFTDSFLQVVPATSSPGLPPGRS